MPSRIVAVVDGVTFVQNVSADQRVRDLQAACNYLLALIDQAHAAKQGGPHG
jgi:hypothetical protein